MDKNYKAAQPDRGAAKAPAALESDQVVCKIARENGAPIAIETARKIIAALAASPASTPEASPASQPVAPETAQEGTLREQFDKEFLSLNGFHTQSELTAEWYALSGMMFRAGVNASRPCLLIERARTIPAVSGMTRFDAAMSEAEVVAKLAAVAPSDAKGKADDAIPELSKAFVTLESSGGEGRTIVLKFNQRDDAYAVHDFLMKIGGKDYQSATSAADAKDAARYRWLRAADWDDITSLYWSPQVQHAGTPEDCMLKLDEAIDAAMAAAPSSEKGNEK